MDSFLERYYRAVTRELGDTHASSRYPKEDRLSDLGDIDQTLFDSLLNVSGQESLMGYSEASITLVDGQIFYPLPFGFRQFLQLEYRDDQNRVLDIIRTKQFYEGRYGVDILTADRGFRLFPPVDLRYADATWVLCYQRSPPLLHYAKAASVGRDGKTLVSGVPPEDAGEIHLVPDYYNGVELRVYRAGNLADPLVRVVTDFVVTRERLSEPQGVFHLREALSPIPAKDVWYEICPTVPLQYDRIYAMDAAIPELIRREKYEKAAQLKKTRDTRWRACVKHFSSNTMDRAPARIHPLTEEDLVSTGEIPV
jgi:hypothetical protein